MPAMAHEESEKNVRVGAAAALLTSRSFGGQHILSIQNQFHLVRQFHPFLSVRIGAGAWCNPGCFPSVSGEQQKWQREKLWKSFSFLVATRMGVIVEAIMVKITSRTITVCLRIDMSMVVDRQPDSTPRIPRMDPERSPPYVANRSYERSRLFPLPVALDLN